MTRGPAARPAPRRGAGQAPPGEHVHGGHPAVQAGYRQPQLLGVRPLSQVADGFVAEAFTMRFIPAREDVNTLDPYRSGNTLQWEAIEEVRRGT